MVCSQKTIAALALCTSLVGFATAAKAQDAPTLPPPPPPPPPGYPAGAPPGQPGPPAPPPAAQPREAVRFEPAEPGLTVLSLRGEAPVTEVVGLRRPWWYERAYVHGYEPVYAPICNQPCSSHLIPGEYHLAISKDGGRIVPAPEPAVINGPSTVRTEYIDRSGMRAAGWVISIAGTIGGIVMIVASAKDDEVCDSDGNCYSRETVNGPLLAGGIGVLLVSGIVGSILAFERDEAHITVQPLTLPSVGRNREAPIVALGAAPPPQGAALQITF
jgi:hypothetical protein